MLEQALPRLLNTIKTGLLGQFIRYGIIGAAGSIIYAIIFALLNETVLPASQSDPKINYYVVNGCAFLVSSVFVFFQNKRWVFSHDGHISFNQVFRFYLIAFIAWLIGTQMGVIAMDTGLSNEYGALIMTMGSSVMINFIGRRHFVFS